MATRSIRFFMRPAEFWSLVWEVADSSGLWVILVGFGKGRRAELATPGMSAMADGSPVQWAFLAADRPDLTLVEPARLRPAAWGWVDSDVPREEGDTLYLAQLAAKSDWYDAESKQILENPAALALFGKVAPTFRERLKRPVWISHIHGGESRIARDIGYSQGAAEWFQAGGQLRQPGVANTRFTIEELATP